MTYGDVVKDKTPEELAKACSIVNILREREQCAYIAEQEAMKWPEDYDTNAGRLAALAIATAIRAQSQDFTTVGEMMKGKQ